MDVLVDTGTAIQIRFEEEGEPFVPDAAGLVWTLRGQSGEVLAGPTSLSGVTDTTTTVIVDAEHNTIENGRRLEKRTLLTQGALGGRPFSISIPYRVVPWLNHTVTPEAVRGFVGLDRGELPDTDIDLVRAYYDVADRLSDATLEAALVEGAAREQAANDAIKAQAVLSLISSIPSRLARKDTDGVRSIERFPVDINQIRDAAETLLATTINLLGTDDEVTPTLIAFTTRTDPFTGV